MMQAKHTHEEFAAFLDEVIKPGNDLLCCVLNRYRNCALCSHPLCKEHTPDGDYCKRCREWLINE
jgi:hypothetical protein